jgi:methionyl-tRNA synthetase
MVPKRQLLVTNALPYANGKIHLGHLLGYIQSDIWVRVMRELGHQTHFICGSDSHGTPIMLRAEKEGISPEQLVARVHQEHQADFAAFGVKFDNFYTTHSEENKHLVESIYQTLCDADAITVREIEQLYDQDKAMFLPDRYVKGSCPRCQAPDQYGDNCEVCGATYTPNDLIDPRSVISNTTPIHKKSEHFFFKLSQCQDFLSQWMNDSTLQPEIKNKLKEWFKDGLKDWDISRDRPYFGFNIPGEKDKYFYVWLDAPVGYMASFQHYIDHQQASLQFDDYWKDDQKTELHHFIGKDIIYFHALFWPAILNKAGYRTPTGIYANGMLTVSGKKMSKSRGTFINAETFLEHANPEQLRYYFAAKLSSSSEDIDLNLNDFVQRINSDLIGKYVNIASRSASFIQKYFDLTLAEQCDDPALWQHFIDQAQSIAQHFEQREFSHAVRAIMAMTDKANQYIDQHKPWLLIKDPQQQHKAHQVCSLCLELFRILSTYLKPILPETAQKVADFLNGDELSWSTLTQARWGQRIKPFQTLMTRIDPKHIDVLIGCEQHSETKHITS